MSDTPRTDAVMWGGYDGPVVVDVEFAQQLERENKRLREALERYMEISDAPPPLKNFALAALEGK